VKPSVRTKILAEEAKLKMPGSSVFAGPVTCQDGKVLYPAGTVPTYAQINSITCLVKGVVGSLPSS
jgi:simple sugar transport system substrate-binding protein/basic membrane protein A